MLTKEQLAILVNELKSVRYANLLAAQDYEAIAALINDRPMVDNPVAQPTVAKRLTVEQFVTALKPAERVTVFDHGALVQEYKDSLAAGNRVYSKKLWTALKSLVSAESVTAVDALLDATELDPNWAAQVAGDSIAMTLGLPRVEPRDVQAVQNV